MGLCVWLVALGPSYSQGELDPADPPATGMKRLDQIHPGTAITTTPVLLTAPGYYYLAGNLDLRTGTGITIRSSDITLDLNGFEIGGQPGSTAIAAPGPATGYSNIVVRNGSIHGGQFGVSLTNTQNATLRDLSINGTSSSAILIQGTGGVSCGNRVEECAIFECGSGISVRESDGNSIRSCLVNSPGGSAISLYGAASHCDANTIEDCLLRGGNITLNADSSGRCRGNTIRRCTVSEAGIGICCHAYDAGTPGNGGILEGTVIDQCAVHEMDPFYGIFLDGRGGLTRGNRIAECAVSNCEDFGIALVADADGSCAGNSVVLCVTHNTGIEGIRLNEANANRVQDNHLVSAAVGITLIGSDRNIIMHNSGGNLNVLLSGTTSDTKGPVVTATGTLANSGNSVHPWANFDR